VTHSNTMPHIIPHMKRYFAVAAVVVAAGLAAFGQPRPGVVDKNATGIKATHQ